MDTIDVGVLLSKGKPPGISGSAPELEEKYACSVGRVGDPLAEGLLGDIADDMGTVDDGVGLGKFSSALVRFPADSAGLGLRLPWPMGLPKPLVTLLALLAGATTEMI